MRTIRVGSRDSRLAVAQAELVMEAVRRAHPELRLELVTMKTKGDRILDRTLEAIGGKGLFVKELDAALLDGRVDITVHSSKDLPAELDVRLPIVAVSAREDPRDALVLPLGAKSLPAEGALGSASPRRRAQLGTLFPGREVAPVRGNVLTRLQKLDAGEYAGLVLAAAGLKRLGLGGRISRLFSEQELLPAAGQGILAVQARAGEDVSWLAEFHDPDAADCLQAERAFVRALGGGCTAPSAAFARISGDELTVTGLYFAPDGTGLRGVTCGPRARAQELGAALARQLKGEDE